MKYRHIGIGRAAKIFLIFGLVLAASSPSLAETQRKMPSAQAEACPGDNGGIMLPSRTMLAMQGTLSSPRTGLFMSIHGAAAITETTSLRRAGSSSPFKTPRGMVTPTL